LTELENSHFEANIIKLPNISASVPQLKRQLQNCKDMVTVPNFPEEPQDNSEEEIKKIFKVLGSAVNPVLREEIRIVELKSGKKLCKVNPHTMGHGQ
jgi:isocitrate dehydrogenase